ncbi:MAG: DUF6259 domain-containing protein [Candidatus Zipacnadales bacterium]
MMYWLLSFLYCLFGVACTGAAAPSIFEKLPEGVYLIRDDSGQWTHNMSLDITHQLKPEYQAKKILDLTNVPEKVWLSTKQARLSIHFGLRDYSWHDATQVNGLDEAFEIIVNGHVHTYPTNCGAPAWPEGKTPEFGWYDFVIPKDEFIRGPNEVILRKASGEKYDDYLYLCIDTSVEPKNSYVAFSGDDWTQEKLTVPGGKGEYMVRLLLITQDLGTTVTWQPGAPQSLEDPTGLILYCGARNGEITTEGLRLEVGQAARLEWHAEAIDQMSPLSAVVEADGSLDCTWLDEQGNPGELAHATGIYSAELPAGRRLKPSGLEIKAAGGAVALKRVTVKLVRSCHPLVEPVNMAPPIAPPARQVINRKPSGELVAEGTPSANKPAGAHQEAQLVTRGLRCRFRIKDQRLHLTSLYNEWTDTEMLRRPEDVALFLVEVDGKRYAGSRDFRVEMTEGQGPNLTVTLRLYEPALKATLRAQMEEEGLRLGLELSNVGSVPVDFKVAFPHLAGLAVSMKPVDDYYFFPWGGGIFSDRPAIIRRGYGDHEAIYQVMDLYSPTRGGGLAIRADDAEGWHKVLALRKHVPGRTEFNGQILSMRVEKAYQWANPLEAVEGLSLAYEYLRRTRNPGESFAPPDAVLWSHAGDWHAAMADYAAWAHRVWQFRPYPSRLGPVVNMIAAGWGQSPLVNENGYRTDFIKPNTDCIELMSWWDWSPLGPWSTPLDKVQELLGKEVWEQWQPYFVKDPVTGELMWNNQPGDYDGYNERFGGLSAFRKAIETYRKMGALVTLYTDPFRLDDASKTGQAHGKEWGVVLANGEYSKAYDVWNPCHDCPEVREWVADTMERVMRDTGADGIRLDEYGHRGFVCYSEQHTHTFAERGITQWQKATTEATKMVRERMDKVDPTSVLTTEHPGYDYMLQYLEGCITYDLTVQATELRPLEVNLQRFYFPECKAYELDHRRADVGHKKRFWNAVGSYGSYYPDRMYQILREYREVFESRDCEALVPTLVPRVYANRFTARDITIYMVYNATGHTIDEPVLAVGGGGRRKWVELLSNERCDVVTTQTGMEAVRLYLPRDDIACIGALPAN